MSRTRSVSTSRPTATNISRPSFSGQTRSTNVTRVSRVPTRSTGAVTRDKQHNRLNNPKNAGRGFIYERVVRNRSGAVVDRYRGQSRNERTFARRQRDHTLKMKRKFGPDARVGFSVLSRPKQLGYKRLPGGGRMNVNALRTSEQTLINRGRQRAVLSNDIRAMNKADYHSAGGRRTDLGRVMPGRSRPLV